MQAETPKTQTILLHLTRKAKEMNTHTNISTPFMNSFIKILKYYYKHHSINEMSVNTLHELTGLKKDISLKVLTSINKQIFN